MPYVKKAGQGALGEDQAITKGKENRKELMEMVINAFEKSQTSSLGESAIGAV